TDITSLTNNVSYRLSFSLCQSFFINGTATTDIYTLSLHDALPILGVEDEGQERFQGAQASQSRPQAGQGLPRSEEEHLPPRRRRDRKSTRLNSSHVKISYAVFCLKKKKKQ